MTMHLIPNTLVLKDWFAICKGPNERIDIAIRAASPKACSLILHADDFPQITEWFLSNGGFPDCPFVFSDLLLETVTYFKIYLIDSIWKVKLYIPEEWLRISLFKQADDPDGKRSVDMVERYFARFVEKRKNAKEQRKRKVDSLWYAPDMPGALETAQHFSETLIRQLKDS
jgi:hypothetical protein